METDKVLALAKEAGGQRKRYMLSGNVVVTFLEDDFIKFAALIQREMEAENAERRADYAELDYWRNRHSDIMHRREHVNNRTLSEIIYLIRQTAIDSARNK